MEAIPDTISIDSLRKNHPHFTDLKHFFEEHFGQPGSDSYENAKANFVESLAAYSIVCYMLQIKDRHNGNILLDNKGHLIHIDFGFFFLSSPGKNSGFESARKYEYRIQYAPTRTPNIILLNYDHLSFQQHSNLRLNSSQ